MYNILTFELKKINQNKTYLFFSLDKCYNDKEPIETQARKR